VAEQPVALVTGISSGIGLATAMRLQAVGFLTFGTVRQTSKLEEVPPGLQLIRLDVRDEQSVLAGVEEVFQRAGRIDAVINNAGIALMGSLEETSIDEAKELFETNFFGVLRMCQAVLPAMRRQRHGRIVNIGSVLGFLPAPYMGIYAASKHALEGYSESLDHEVRRLGIRVSVIEPGFTRTSIGQNSQLISGPLAEYSIDRNRAAAALSKNLAEGVPASAVASVVATALTSRNPRLRYPAGSEARLLSLLRKFAPQRILEAGLRREFGLSAH